ncbi:MAG: hypothetical protein FJW64_09360 [Actinobacteria bacterium]|nr:hypothetical protein [Actinomycetota bacterium]
MADPRSLRIDVGPIELQPDNHGQWTLSSSRGGSGAASGISSGWSDWVALAHRVLQADAIWRDVEGRGDAWDQGFAAGRGGGEDPNPYRG